MADEQRNDNLGPNTWLVDEMFEQYRADPASVSASWQEFFADYQRDTDATSNGPSVSLPATGRAGDTGQVRLTIDDDGSAAGGRAPAGYGLVGMRERASLLGGTFHAGPAAERGWRVEAVLPRNGTPR